MKCPKCGYQPREGSGFCPACGTELSPRKKKGGIVIWVLSGVIVALVGALVAVLLLRPSDDGEAARLEARETSAPRETVGETAPIEETEPAPTTVPRETDPPATAVAQPATEPPTEPATEPPTQPATEPPASDSGTGLSLQEQYKLNLFLSNFSEQWFGDCDSATAPEGELLRFAFLHTKINQYSEITRMEKDSEFYYTITYERAKAQFRRFFDRALEVPAEGTTYDSGFNWSIFYSDGRFYFPYADGESYSCMSVADSIESRGDGTYDVTFLIYSVDEFNGGGSIVSDKSYYYLNAQGAASQEGLTYRGSGSAVVRLYQTDEIDSYQLISYRLDS